MAEFEIFQKLEFRDALKMIDGLRPGDQTGSQSFGDLRQDYFVFEATQTSVRQLQVTTTGAGTSDAETNFAFSNERGFVYIFTVEADLDLAGGYDLTGAIKAIRYATPRYESENPRSKVEAFGRADEMEGQGRLIGRGGNDEITLRALDQFEVGASARSLAIGGDGRDLLIGSVQVSTLKGGRDGDRLIAEFGKVKLFGGSGWDRFEFDNGARDPIAFDKARDRDLDAFVQDFTAGRDTLIFAFDRSGPKVRLEDIAGEGTLADVAAFRLGGLSHVFKENSAGDAVLVRRGTDTAGHSYDERVVLKGVALDEVGTDDVVYVNYLL